MKNKSFHLAQFNIAEAKAPLDSPLLKGFVERIDEINGLADGEKGFVWRMQDDSGNAMLIQAYDNPDLLINMSIWESVEDLKRFTYQTMHKELIRDKKQWFHHIKAAYYVLWWIPEGHIPTLTEAKERLDLLREKGASPEAFNFKRSWTNSVVRKK